MTVSPRIEPNFAPTLGLAEALYFDSHDKKLFGWLHRPLDGLATRTGLVICQPFGYEAICSHRSMRCFADASATLGLPTLRFDYVGTGDSADIDPDANQLDLWSRDVIAAVGELQRRTGVESVCLLGFRLGALLATLVANQCEAVSALILVAPVISGRRYLGELRTTRLASSLGAEPAAMANKSTREGSMEVCGFSLSAATIEGLSQIDLTKLAAPRVSEILFIDRTDLPSARIWAETISGLGIQTEYLTMPGFVEMMLTPPQFTIVPQAMIGAMRNWLVRFELKPLGQVDVGSESRRGGAPTLAAHFFPCVGDAPEPNAPLTERPVLFGRGAVLFGIVTAPGEGEKPRGAVILLNAGADHHIGANRMYVSLARRWARRGYVVLRMDLAGLGDSGTRHEQADNEVFPSTAIEDIRAAVDFIRSRYSVDDVTLGGLCSGAYHSLRAAVSAVPINRILMVNPQNFFWKQGTGIKEMHLAEVVYSADTYLDSALSAASWKKLLKGEVNVWRIVKIYTHRFCLALESTIRDTARRLRIRLPRDLGWELEEIVARGVRVVMVFSRGDIGVDLLKLQAGSSLNRLSERLRVHIVDRADHNFSHSGPRALMEGILCNELFGEDHGLVSGQHRLHPLPKSKSLT